MPEIGQSFACPSTFRIFGCQNPTAQGGGRKGLPQSFLNRFTKVYVEAFKEEDLIFITTAMYPSFPPLLVEKMVRFNCRMHRDSMVEGKFARVGSPWEFNLRDIFRWCDLLLRCSPSPVWGPRKETETAPAEEAQVDLAAQFVDILYSQRMRTDKDRDYVSGLFLEVMGRPLPQVGHGGQYFTVTPHSVQVGQVVLPRVQQSSSWAEGGKLLLQATMPALEALMRCAEMNWMAIVLGPPASGKVCPPPLFSIVFCSAKSFPSPPPFCERFQA